MSAEESGYIVALEDTVSKNHNELKHIIENLIFQIKRQEGEIKELKHRLDQVEDTKEIERIDLQKLNHNVNTTLDLDLLTESQKPKVKSFFGGAHYTNIGKTITSFVENYESESWKLLSNLGKMQIFSKNPESNDEIHILGRCEISHSVNDIADEIWTQDVFVNKDPSLIETEVVQNVGDDCNVYYVKFKRLLAADVCDLRIACQKIVNPPDNYDQSIVFPMVSVKAFKRNPTEDAERLELACGGWVLKPLTDRKTLVNIFFNLKFPTSKVPDPLLSKHAKTLISMLRTLET